MRVPQAEAAEAQEAAQVAPDAATVLPVRNLRVLNLRDTSVTLSWTTEAATSGYVRFGESAEQLDQVAYDSRGASSNSTTHHVVLNQLNPQTTYYVEIISGGEKVESAVETISTAPVLETVSQPDTIYGKVYLPDGVTPASGALVYLQLEDADGQGSSSDTMPAMLLSGTVSIAAEDRRGRISIPACSLTW